ncbi:1157_t:CDS:2, partial [Dentiscutata heterogama]
QPLSLDKDPLLLDDECSLDESSINSKPFSDEESQNTITETSTTSQQNIIAKRKSNSNLQNNNSNKKSKQEKVGNDNLEQCTSTFEITTSTTNLASYLRTIHRLSKTSPLLPLKLVNHQKPLPNKKQNRITSRILAWIVDDIQPFNVLVNERFQDILHETEPQIQFLDEDLVKQNLFKSVIIKRLQKDLIKDKERNVRNNAKALEKLLLDDDKLLRIQELVELLGLFAHVTTIVEETLTYLIICNVHDKIELSFDEYWEEPGPEKYIAARLDPRFKNLGFEPAKFELTKDELKHKMMESIKNNNYSLPNNNSPTLLLSSLFEEITHKSCP